MANSIAVAPEASVIQALRSAATVSASFAPDADAAAFERGSTASYPAERIASINAAGAVTAGSKRTAARLAMRSTRADSTPAVEFRADSTWCWQEAQVIPRIGRVIDSEAFGLTSTAIAWIGGL